MTNKEAAMLSIRLPEEIEARLERLAKQTGRTKSFYAREAILEKIEDMEDVYLAEHVLERIRKGEEKTLSAEEMWRGLED
jgi:RHH-type rel operon transcriptional repressor/antitoxin RelB